MHRFRCSEEAPPERVQDDPNGLRIRPVLLLENAGRKALLRVSGLDPHFLPEHDRPGVRALVDEMDRAA